MFCDEPIKRVYIGERNFCNLEGAACYFDHWHDLAYHMTEGYRRVLETENWAITLDVNGVRKEPKITLYTGKGEWLRNESEEAEQEEVLDPDDELFEGFETTMFVGQRLKEVRKDGDIYLAEFDDFTIKVIPYALGMMESFPSRQDDRNYCATQGCEWLLTRKCDCGGEGEILLDYVSDYVVCCKKCKRSTYAEMQVRFAIESWNNGNLPCLLDEIVIE